MLPKNWRFRNYRKISRQIVCFQFTGLLHFRKLTKLIGPKLPPKKRKTNHHLPVPSRLSGAISFSDQKNHGNHYLHGGMALKMVNWIIIVLIGIITPFIASLGSHVVHGWCIFMVSKYHVPETHKSHLENGWYGWKTYISWESKGTPPMPLPPRK